MTTSCTITAFSRGFALFPSRAAALPIFFFTDFEQQHPPNAHQDGECLLFCVQCVAILVWISPCQDLGAIELTAWYVSLEPCSNHRVRQKNYRSQQQQKTVCLNNINRVPFLLVLGIIFCYGKHNNLRWSILIWLSDLRLCYAHFPFIFVLIFYVVQCHPTSMIR